MHYELYVDSLFFLNFMMNLYLLILVDRSIPGRASPGRLAAGAAVGALCFLLPFWWKGPAVCKLAAGALAGSAGMLCITFRVRSLGMFLGLLERMLLYSFGMGGALLFLARCAGPARGALTGVLGTAGAGGLVFLLFLRFRTGLKAPGSLCRAVLSQEGREMRIDALIDSGNSLREPVSGKPVCIVEREVFRGLWEREPEGFRAVPYHSIGKRKGILPGYLLERLRLEAGGMVYDFAQVYIAVSDEEISAGGGAGTGSVKMIVNPGLFAQSRKGKPKVRQNERHNDSESDDSGQNAV